MENEIFGQPFVSEYGDLLIDYQVDECPDEHVLVDIKGVDELGEWIGWYIPYKINRDR